MHSNSYTILHCVACCPIPSAGPVIHEQTMLMSWFWHCLCSCWLNLCLLGCGMRCVHQRAGEIRPPFPIQHHYPSFTLSFQLIYFSLFSFNSFSYWFFILSLSMPLTSVFPGDTDLIYLIWCLCYDWWYGEVESNSFSNFFCCTTFHTSLPCTFHMIEDSWGWR